MKIIVRMVGGLGNQLFIYSYAKGISTKHNVPLFIEKRTGFLRDKYKRTYRLNNFKIEDSLCTLFESFFFAIRKRFPGICKFLYANSVFFSEEKSGLNLTKTIEQVIKENKFETIYLEGLFQNEFLVFDHEKVIKKNLRLNEHIFKSFSHLAAEIRSVNSVAIHVRRVQYENSLPLAFYQKAIAMIASEVKTTVFYIFSDDINWCRANLKIDCLHHFVENKPNNELADFWLMSNCKFFILANSTYSWWAAWLAENAILTICPAHEYWPASLAIPPQWQLCK